MTRLPPQLVGAAVQSAQVKRGILHVGFEGRFYFEIRAPWITENLSTGIQCQPGEIVGSSLVSVNASALELEIAFRSHRICVTLRSANESDYTAAILFEADWPCLQW